MSLDQSWASEAGHWYTKNAEPAYEVPDKSSGVKCPACTGSRRSTADRERTAACAVCDERGYVYPRMRSTTLRDARILELAPSVTGITKVKANWQVVRYKLEQLATACYTAPPDWRSLPLPEWLAKIQEDAASHAKAARDDGTDIHVTMERGVRGETLVGYKYADWFDAMRTECIRVFGRFPDFQAEKSFVSRRFGYGAKLDAVCDDIVMDFKTREFDGDETPDLYDDYPMQLAAQAQAVVETNGGKMPERLAVGFLDRKEPKCRIVVLEPEMIKRGWKMFRHCLALKQLEDNYVPVWATERA